MCMHKLRESEKVCVRACAMWVQVTCVSVSMHMCAFKHQNNMHMHLPYLCSPSLSLLCIAMVSWRLRVSLEVATTDDWTDSWNSSHRNAIFMFFTLHRYTCSFHTCVGQIPLSALKSVQSHKQNVNQIKAISNLTSNSNSSNLVFYAQSNIAVISGQIKPDQGKMKRKEIQERKELPPEAVVV